MIEDDAKSTIFGIVLGVVMIAGIFMDWTNDPIDSVFVLNSDGGPPIISASSENKGKAKKQEIEPVKKQNIEPVKKLIIEPTFKQDSSNKSKSTQSPQTVDEPRKDN